MLRVILAAMALAASTAHADEWRTEDTQRETAYLVLHAMDWAQTRNIARNPNQYSESGVIARSMIGAHPSVAQVNQYMIGSAVLQYAIARALPSECRKVFQYVTIIDAGVSVSGNFRIGLTIGF